uniref:AP180 N-terminal homology (ANTH) domain-containing protein n=1 Tax=Kalanchoe fedtschenkoi TaxID=63787 RepID=A0A7N0TH31_KALFE
MFKVQAHSRTRLLSREELLEQLPALQQLLYRLIGCQPEGAACYNHLIQYALALVLKESFKIYCGINDGIINLVDMFFEMSRHDAVKALNIYKRAGQQAENLAKFYEFCKALDLSRNFQFPTLRQPPPSFLSTMEEYIKEAPQSGSVSNKKLDYQEKPETPRQPEEPEQQQDPESPKTEELADEVEEVQEDKPTVNIPEESQVKTETEPAPLISADDVGDLLGLNEPNPQALELEQANALALAIVQPGNDPLSTNHSLNDFGAGSSGWELALVTTPTNSSTNQLADRKLAGGFDKLLLDSLYEDNKARRQLELQNAGYGYDMPMQYPPYAQSDPFAVSNNIAPPSNVQLAMMQQQQMMHQNQYQQQQQQQQYQMPMYQNQQQFPQQNMMMVPHGQPQYLPQYPQQQLPQGDPSNPFSDPFSLPTNTAQHPGGHHLL